MFSLFKSEPVLDEESKVWMAEVFQWALRQFDRDFFYNKTILVRPTNEHFPGRENSVEGMAQLIHKQVGEYAGMSHWPTMLVNEDQCQLDQVPNVRMSPPLRGQDLPLRELREGEVPFIFAYNSHQINDPGIMIATFAHTYAHYLGTMATEPPPGGEINWPHITELLAVFMGFGVFMANTAHVSKVRSCGSCGGPPVERQTFLSQYDISYALTMFCQLKNIPAKHALGSLKKSLQPYYKRASKDVQKNLSALKLLS